MNRSNEADYARIEAELRWLERAARLSRVLRSVPASLSVEQLGEITEVSERSCPSPSSSAAVWWCARATGTRWPPKSEDG